MNFDLSQLVQGPVRDLVLNQITKQFGISGEQGGSLLTKGLSMVLGGMTQKASTQQGASALFDLIKNTNFSGNPLDILTGKADAAASGSLLETGAKLLPSLFGERADSITDFLSNNLNVSSTTTKGVLGMLLPTVFSFFKGKILNGLGLNGFLGLLGDQTKALASNLDSNTLGALGFSGNFNDVLGNVAKVGAGLAGAGAAVKAATSSAASSATAAASKAATAVKEDKKSGLGKWVIGGLALLAAIFGLKNCGGTTTSTQATPAPTAETAPASVASKVVEGLGNLAWAKSDKDFTVSGTVQNDGVKANILDAFKGLAGNLPLVDKLAVDANAPQFSFNNFGGLVDALKAFPNVNGSFADKAFNLIGQVANGDEKASLVDKVKGVLGSAFDINADGVKADNPVANLVEGLGNLGWAKSDKDFTVSGTVQNEGVKANILDAFKGLAGNLPLVDKLAVDANAPQFSFGNFAGLANALKAFPAVNGEFADKVVNLVGQVANAGEKTALVDNVKSVLGDVFSINADKVTVAEAAQAAAPAANAAEEEAAEIADVNANKIDLEIVFNTGSSEISSRYFRRLDAFAKHLVESKRQGEIAGYTDNTGNAAANQQLSEKRAIAVRNYLVSKGVEESALTAKGYGQENPVADNNTAEGRAKNRRIEFNAR
ncbi:hypothetical protein B0187_07110 [Haemophilus paracuniculus]|uniref:OmpA-like domain-containing protein n=1 Tax=Haemophilus paracuniculus TaxID=734 RepID=A0A1T0ARL2_9PAST|nr:OmpA family protein [Haemophilus paracuniculus]OOR99020.1 hypothetical protein B0187_07110 [Haemophilus paracuniculus]